MRWWLFVPFLVVRLALAEPIGPGSLLPEFPLADQHEVAGRVPPSTRALLFSHDMDGGRVIKEAFAGVDQGWLDARDVVYIADISGMPALVSRVMAIPNMRRRSYRMLLDRDGAVTQTLPRRGGQVTLLSCGGGVVHSVEQFDAGSALRARLDGLGVR